MKENKKRISLLSETEQNELYSVPEFSRNNREYYFSLNISERTILAKYFTYKTKIYFILQLGYFKATSRFYNFSFENVKEDAEYVRNVYFDVKKRIPHRKIADYIINAQKERIAKLFDYKIWNSTFTYQAEEHLKELLKIVPKHHDAFRELLSFFKDRKITIPSYRVFQDIFTTAVSLENDRLQKITNSFSKLFKSQLELLILEREGIGYLGVIKSDQKDFKYTALREEVKKAEQIKEIYQYCKDKIPHLGLSKSCIAYYCELTDQMHVSRIRKLSKWKQYLHVMCFAYYRYQQFMDNLIVSFQFHMADMLKETKAHIKGKSTEFGTSLTMNWSKVSKLLRFIPSNTIAPEDTYETFQARAYSILPETEYVKLADIMDGIAFDKEKIRWDFYNPD